MARVTASGSSTDSEADQGADMRGISFPRLDVSDLNSDNNSGRILEFSSTFVRIGFESGPVGGFDDFGSSSGYGGSFTFSPANFPLASFSGTVTSYGERSFDDNGSDMYSESISIVGFSLPVTRFQGGQGALPSEAILAQILAGNDRITGTEFYNDYLIGFAGNDLIDGLGGADTMDGGRGNDVYRVESSSDKVIEDINGGIDRVISSTSFSFVGQYVENLLLTGRANADVTGNTRNNIMIGNAGSNELSGGAGVDRLDGNAGADELKGGRGNDRLNGGIGNDFMTGGFNQDRLNGGRGADSFDFNLTTESARGAANRDVISDFSRAQRDKIDLFSIDADTDGTSGNQAFTFIGGAAFSGVDGQLRCRGGLVQGDVNGDRLADFEIKVNVSTLVASDFRL